MALRSGFRAQIGHFRDVPMWVNGKTADLADKIKSRTDARTAATDRPRCHRPPRNARGLLIGKTAAAATDRPATQLLLPDGRRACLIGKNAAATDRPATRAQRSYFFSPQTAPAAAHKSSSRPLQKRARVENTPPAAALQLPVAHPPCGSPGGRAHRPRPELRTLGLASNTPRRRPLNSLPSM